MKKASLVVVVSILLFQSLVESYTEEQRALIAEMHAASRQEKLCLDRLRFPDGATGKRKDLVAWPIEPK